MTLLGVALFYALAAFRVEHLITTDMITARPRTVALAKLPKAVGAGLTCSACMGVWASAAVLTLAWLLGFDVGGWQFLLWLPVVAGAQLLFAAVEKRLAR